MRDDKTAGRHVSSELLHFSPSPPDRVRTFSESGEHPAGERKRGPSRGRDGVGGPSWPVGQNPPLAQPPISVFVYGPSSPLVNLVLFALAEEANASFHWLDIRKSGDQPPQYDPARLGWIDERRSWTADPFDAFAMENARANAALFELVRADEPSATLVRLTEFLRLPDTMQKILSEAPVAGKPGVLAVANAQRTATAFPSATLSPILDAMAWAGYSLFVGFAGAPPSARRNFSYVLRIDGESPERWRESTLTLEGDLPMGAIAARESRPLSTLPFAARVLRRAIPEG